jgi:hypothetical protein
VTTSPHEPLAIHNGKQANAIIIATVAAFLEYFNIIKDGVSLTYPNA